MKKRAKLVAARVHKNWTLEEASEHIGCAPNTLSRWELGNMMPSVYYMQLIATIYAPQSNGQQLQHVLSTTIEEFTLMNTGHEAALTRREALQRLAMFPVLFIAN